MTLWRAVKEKPMVWLAWGWTIFSTVNTSAFVLAPMALLPYLTRESMKWWVLAALLGVSCFLLVPKGRISHLDRLRDTACALVTLDDQKIDDADPSAAARFLPTIRGFRAMKLADPGAWTGHGVDSDQHDTAPRPCDRQNRGFGGIFSMAYNYGLLCALAFWWLIGTVTLIKGRWLSVVTFLFAMQMSADYNMQLIWLILAFSMTMKYDVLEVRTLLRCIPAKSNTRYYRR